MSERKYDLYSFWTNPKDEQSTKLECLNFPEDIMGKYADDEGNEHGHKYHIVLVKDHDEDEEKFDKFDQFEAILTDPLTYIEQLIDWGWYGVIVRKSEKSMKIVDFTIAKIEDLL